MIFIHWPWFNLTYLLQLFGHALHGHWSGETDEDGEDDRGQGPISGVSDAERA